MRSSDGLIAGSPSAAPEAVRPAGELPPETLPAGVFALFNGLSWQIMLGAPTILYAKSQGASQWVLGFIASLMPLLVVFQIPAAHHIPRYGYKRFILAGWTTRSFFIFAAVAVPLLPAPPAVRLGLVVMCLFGFNLVRGITAGAWMPWMAELVPEHLRGRFLARDATFTQAGSLVALLGCALLLAGDRPRPWQFASAFLLSALAATVSLLFLRRLPDVTAPETMKTSGHRVPWVHMLLYRPFLRLVLLSVGWALAVSGLAVFTVAFLKESGYRESHILLLSTLSFVGALLSVPVLGRRADRIGSKPIVLLCGVLVMGVIAGWLAMAAGLAGRSVGLIAVLYLAAGIAHWNFFIAAQRLVMCTIPLMGRNHFFALHTVIGSVVQGLTPIAWGIALDLIGPRTWVAGPIALNRYSLFFGLSLLTAAAVALFSLRLREPPALAGNP